MVKNDHEKAIENAIFDYLEFRYLGILAFKVETMGVFDPVSRRFRKAGKNVIRGTSDIVGTINIRGLPISFYLEVKSATGTQSENQMDFEERVDGVNGFYFIVRSIKDAEAAIEEIRSEIYKRMSLFLQSTKPVLPVDHGTGLLVPEDFHFEKF